MASGNVCQRAVEQASDGDQVKGDELHRSGDQGDQVEAV